MRVIISSLVALSFSLCAGIAVAGELDAKTAAQLAQLEQKYFAHTFPAEDLDSRTQRLEKLIFGDPVEGDVQKRIQNLAATTDSAKAFDSGTPRVAEPATSKAKPQSSSAAAAAAAVDTDDQSSGDNGKYPHISELEMTILGHSYDGEAVAKRLGRMETKAFGSTANIPDLSDRTDLLDAWVAQHAPKRPTTNTASAQYDEPGPDGTAGDAPSDYPRVTALEAEILGQSFQGQSLTARLSRMEAKAFGKPSDDMDLSERTDALDKYAQTKLHKHIHEQPSNTETAQEGSRSGRGAQVAAGVGRQLAAVAANTLLGVAGVRGIGFGGMGGPGGFGASPAPSHAQTPTDGSERMDDPAIFSQDPPPPTARMITRVAWCEQQVFGHTFGTMHLTERLEQLSSELNFDRGKKGSELMDRMGNLIKTVQARKQGAAPIGYAAQPPTH